MKPEDIQQSRVDEAALEFVDACFTVVDALSMAHTIRTAEVPSLDDVLRNAEWAWQFSVADPLQIIYDETGYRVTDLEDIRLHFMMLVRRAHMGIITGIVNIIRSAENDEDETPEVTSRPALTGMYL